MSGKQNFMVGLTAIIAVVGFCVILVLFGWAPQILQDAYPIRVEMADASGVAGGSRVLMRGIDIGWVQRVEFDDQSSTGLSVYLVVRDDVPVPVGTIAVAQSELLGGVQNLKLDFSHLAAEAVANALPKDGSAVIKGERRTMAGELSKELGSAVTGVTNKFGSLQGQFERLATNFEKLSAEWTSVGKNVNDLIEARTVADVDANKVKANLSTIFVRTDKRLKEMESTLAAINELVNDPEVRKDIQTTMNNMRTLSEKLNTGADTVAALAEDSRRNFDQVAKKFVAVADDLSLTINTLQQTVADARSGKGTMGKLLRDPSLYDNFNDTVERFGLTVTEVKMLIEKWQKEGVPVKLD